MPLMDVFKPRGQTKASQPDAGGATTRNVPVLGIVKDNIDPTRSGRIRVYIADFGADNPDDSNAWVTVGYMSPFYGQTEGSSPKTGYGDYKGNPVSYGMWASPPDIGSVVVCIFIKGDPNFGYYIGCLPNPEALQMVPAIGAVEDIVANAGEANSYSGATRLPVTNINPNNKEIADSSKFLTAAKPVHSYAATILSQQGLIRDPVRGPITTSAQRESPSRVGFGVSTPGRPIYEGGFTDETVADAANQSGQQSSLKVTSRRAGHTFVMDDGDLLGRDQLVRLRTSLGHQILLSDSGQALFIIHANGQSWIELGKEGTIDMYSTNSVNIRTQGDLNLHADNNVNIQAGKNLNVVAGEGIQIETDKNLNVRTGGNLNEYVMGNRATKVDGSMSMAAGGEASYASAATTFINGSKINLNTGSASAVPGVVAQLPIIAHTDTLNDTEKGWIAAPGKLMSVVSRAPTHMPWSAAGQAVDVKTNASADANLPPAPSPEIAKTNNAVTGVQVPQVTPAIVSTVPSVSAVSGAIDKNSTAALVGQTAIMAAAGPAKDAVKAGAGIVETAAGKVASIGQLAQTPTQLEAAGILKPGAASLVNSLVQSGKTVEQAMASNLFTGKQGAENLSSLVSNTGAQVDALVTNMKQAQTQLTTAGIITGKESPTQIGGLVMSTVNQGVENTANFVKNAAGNVSSLVSPGNAANTLLGPTQNMISAGNLASNFAATATGGLSALAGSISKVGSAALGGLQGLATAAKGVVGAAFDAIKNGLPKIAPGVPQNLKKITDQASAALGNNPVSATGVAGAASGLNTLAGGEKTVANIVSKATGSITSAATSAVNSIVSSVTSTVNTITSSVTSTVNNITSTVSGLKSSLPSVPNSIPGASKINDLIKAPGDALNKLKDGTASLSSLAKAGLPAGAAAQLDSAITSLSSGGSIPIQLPKIATDTFDRTTLDSQLKSTLGDPKIPAPVYTGNAATYGETKGTATLADYKAKLKDQQARYDAQFAITKTAKEAWIDAATSLPAGDPAIAATKKKYEDEFLKLAKISEELA